MDHEPLSPEIIQFEFVKALLKASMAGDDPVDDIESWLADQ